MEKKEISMQLFTTRHFQPYDPILKFLSNSGIANIELFGLESMNIDEFKSIMDQSNITSKSTHVSYESLTNPSDIINRANKMNIKHVIVPAPPARKDAEFKNTFNMNEEEWMEFGKKIIFLCECF
jgi:sugar phosphate isomerase/epimerase